MMINNMNMSNVMNWQRNINRSNDEMMNINKNINNVTSVDFYLSRVFS